MNKNSTKITPLGGLKQIGSNMILVESNQSNFIIDCGILFANEDVFEINYLIPDMRKIDSVPTDLIITHGHEDHIGAVSHVLDFFPDIQIWASPFSANLIRKKLARDKKSTSINILDYNVPIVLGDIEIDLIHVNHSIPETYGLLLKNVKNDFCLFYVSDFKVDHLDPYCPAFDFKKLKLKSSSFEYKLLMADSTNIHSSKEKTLSESDLIEDFRSIIKEAKGRIFISLFSSNIYRIQTILNCSIEYKKTLVAHGRSMINYIQTASEEGYLKNADYIKTPEQCDPKDQNLVVLLSGCQGDLRGTLRRVASGEDSSFKIAPSDTFLLSSKAIPGNEKKVSSILNLLAEKECTIFTSDDKKIHASGHPGKKDLKELYESYNPQVAIPIHGESYLLRKHLEFINQNYPLIKSHCIYNFDSLVINSNHTTEVIKSSNQPRPLIIVGDGQIIDPSEISNRRKIASQGVVFVSIRLPGPMSNQINSEVSFIGLPNSAQDKLEHFKKLIVEKIELNKKMKPDELKEEIRISTRRYFHSIIGQRPIAVIQLT